MVPVVNRKKRADARISMAERAIELRCRDGNSSRIILRSRALLTSGIGMPLRALLRREFSIRLQVGVLPVYLVRCGEDLHAGWDLFGDSLKVLEKNSPIWWRRMPQLLRSIMVIDKLSSSAFYLADRCCCLNPWNVRRQVEEPETAAIILAGSLVHALCSALLLADHRGCLGVCHRRRLSLRANIRFLQTCLRTSDDADVQAAINALRSYCRV